jgi:hypothetical protein
VFKQNSYIHKVFSLTSVPLLITSHIKLNADDLLILILAPDGFYHGNNKITELRTILQRESQNS